MELGLRGRTAIVCGASQGMGLAIAEALAAEGANVAMFARRRGGLEREAERTGAPPGRGAPTNPPPRGAARAERAAAAWGGLGVPVGGGGGPPGAPAAGLTDQAVESAVELLLL